MSTDEKEQTSEHDTAEQSGENDTAEQTSESDTSESTDEKKTPELSDEGKEKVKEMRQAYDDDRPTAVLPGTDNTITGVAVNEWLDDDGNPKFGKDEGDDKQQDDADDKQQDHDGDKQQDDGDKQQDDAG